MLLTEDRPAVAPAEREGGLFEHCVCRVAGLPVGCLEEMRAPESAAVVAELLALETELTAAREPLAAALFAAVGAAEDRDLRSRLLTIRRAVHNLRAFAPAELAAAAPHLPADLAAALARFRDRAARHGDRRAALAASHPQELAACRRKLQEATADPDFQKGLLMASRDLSASLDRYTRADARALGAKERQIERGLLRYLTRMAMKTSPFSTFTAVVPGRFAADAEGEPRFVGEPRAKRSLVRLNKRIYAVLKEELLGDPEIRARLGVELNPTLRAAGEQWLFLAAFADREVFQRVPKSPVLDLFKEVLNDEGALPLAALEARVAGHPALEASPEQVAAFTERLLAIGFLRLRFGIREQEVDWDLPLKRLLEVAGSAEALRAVRFLERLRAARDAFAEAPVERRRELLDETGLLIRSYESLTRPASMRSDVPFYEDAGAAAVLAVPRHQVAGLAGVLADFVRLTSRLAWPRQEQAAARHFLATFYGGRPVPLLTFYEDYHREHLKEHLARVYPQPAAVAETPAGRDGEDGETGAHGGQAPAYDEINPFGLEPVERIRRAGLSLKRLILERWQDDPAAEQIGFGRADLEAIVAGVPAPVHPCFSVSLFTQLLPGFAPDGGPGLLTSNYLTGFGKYFSRFLDLMPGEVQEDLAESNRGLGDVLLAEICGDSGFNANLHPPLLPWEISYPTGESGAAEGQLLAADLDVLPAPADASTVCLRHRPTGRRVVPLDLGFQNPMMRPPLFRLLSSFAPAASYGMYLPEVPWEPAEAPEPPPAVVHRPRIVYDGRLVLARRRWTVEAAALPHRAAGETDDAWFLRAGRWRREQGLPEEVFLSFFRAAGATTGAAAGSAAGRAAEAPRQPERSRDHPHKPQYVDFRNPLLVDLLGRMVEGRERFKAHFYERLPGRDHLVRHGGDRWVTELVVQLDAPGGAAAALASEEGSDAP